MYLIHSHSLQQRKHFRAFLLKFFKSPLKIDNAKEAIRRKKEEKKEEAKAENQSKVKMIQHLV